MKSKYDNAFTEVYTILSYLDIDEYEKIPKEIIEVIENNMNNDYEYEMNEDVDLNKQPMLPETKAILFNLFRDYLSTPEQRKKIINMQKKDMQKIEDDKRKKYSANVFDNVSNDKNTKLENDNESLVKVNNNIFKKIMDGIKKFFLN